MREHEHEHEHEHEPEAEQVERGEDNGVLVSPFWGKVLAGIATAGIVAGATAAAATYNTVGNLRIEVRGVIERVSKLESARDAAGQDRERDLDKIDDRLDELGRAMVRIEGKVESLSNDRNRSR